MNPLEAENYLLCPLFAALSPSAIGRLAELALTRSVAGGRSLTCAGDEWPYLFVVLDGRLSVVKGSSEGRSLVVTELGAGEVFWGLAFFEPGRANPMSVVVEQDSRVVQWARDDLLPLLLANGSVAWELARLMLRRMLAASEVMDGLAFQPVAGRLARLLMDFPGQDPGRPIARSLTLDEMAARIGSTREMTCRVLQKFADDDLIKITRTEFEILNRGRLAGLAQKERP